MEGQGAYGAGRAGAPFNFLTFIKKPQVIVRLIALFFAIIVFGCISSRGYAAAGEDSQCYYNNDPNACGYGVGIGVIAFLICIAFLVLDALFEQLSGVQQRKYVVLADIVVSALWCFLWFVGFCYMTNQWNKGKDSIPTGSRDFVKNDLQAALAFSFFSVIAWGALVGLAILRYRKGVTEDFGAADGTNDRPDIAQSSNPYASFGGEVDQSYQQAPFSGTDASQAPPPPSSNYQPPTY